MDLLKPQRCLKMDLVVEWPFLGFFQATWSVSEDRCRHEMVLSSSVVTRRQFELDLGDNMTFNASVKLDG